MVVEKEERSQLALCYIYSRIETENAVMRRHCGMWLCFKESCQSQSFDIDKHGTPRHVTAFKSVKSVLAGRRAQTIQSALPPRPAIAFRVPPCSYLHAIL